MRNGSMIEGAEGPLAADDPVSRLTSQPTTRRLLRLSAVAALLPLAGCSYDGITFLAPQGIVAAQQRGYFIDILLVLLIVVLPVILLTPLLAWRYRYRSRSTQYEPNWSFSWPLEILAWGVPVGVVIVMAIWLWRGTHALDPYASLPGKPLPVSVVGYDWKWLFIYPTLGVASIGEFPFPADRPVAMKLTSDTVMQSFFIPSLGSQIYAMAGMVTRLNLKAQATGSFMGENTQYNGEGFQQQHFSAIAMSPDDFKAWVQRVRTTGIPLTADVYGIISKRSEFADMRQALNAQNMPNGTVYFRDVDPSLFINIVASFHGGPQDPAELVAGKTANVSRALVGASAARPD